MLAPLLGVAWGAILAWLLLARGRRVAVVTRFPSRHVAALETSFAGHARGAARRVGARLEAASGPIGRVLRGLVARRVAQREEAALSRELPVALDLLGVAVGAGCTPYLAVETAAEWSPPRPAAAFRSVLRACALGAGLEAALDDAPRAAPALAPLADALLAVRSARRAGRAGAGPASRSRSAPRSGGVPRPTRAGCRCGSSSPSSSSCCPRSCS